MRFLGTDIPDIEAMSAEYQGAQSQLQPAFDISNKANADVQETFQRIRRDQEANTQRFIQSQMQIGEAAKAYAVLDQAQRESSQSGFNNLLGAVQGVAQTYLRFKDQQAQAEAARLKADQEAEDRQIKLTKFQWEAEDRQKEQLAALKWLAANEESEKLLNIAPDVIRGDGGPILYERMRTQLLQQYIPYLKPEQGVELIRKLQSPVRTERDRQFDAQQKMFEKESAAMTNKSLQEGLFMLNAKAGMFIKYAGSPDEVQKHTQEYLTMMQDYASKMNPTDAANFIAQAYQELGKTVDLGQGQFLELNKSLSNFREFTQVAAQESARLRQSGPSYLPQYRANLAYLRKRYGITDMAGFDDPYEADKVMADLQDRQSKFDAAFERQELRAVERTNVTYDEVVALGYTFYADPRQRVVFEKYLRNPKIKSAISLAESMEKYDKLVNENRDKKIRFREELARLDASDLKQWLSWVSSDAGDDLIKELGIKSRLNVQIEDILKSSAAATAKDKEWLNKVQVTLSGRGELDLVNLATADTAGGIRSSSSVTPEEIQAIRSKVMQVNTAIKQEIQKRSDLIDRDPEFLRIQAQLASYKLLDPKQRAAQAKVASGRVQQVLTRINQTLEQQQARSKANPMPQQRPGGVSPEYPFNLPQLETQTIRGSKIITPFKPGTRGVVTSDYKDPRPGRLHAGIDIAVPVGTPLIFYDQGVVDYAGNVSGYGKLVDIKTPDGKIHRFAHLDSFRVKKGDKVTPGMFFARTGNTDGGTGISTGPHLHWEVRNNPFGGFEASIDVTKHMAQYRNGSGRMVRNSQQQPTHVPLDSVRGAGGSYIRTGLVQTADGGTFNVRYSLGAPFKQDYVSPYIGDYRRANKANANYGYKQLADDPAFAKKIAQVASKIGIPAMWLVDIMAHESGGFQTDITHDKTMATGLIQFMPDTARSLGTSVEALRNMSKVQQMDYVEKYFRVNGFSKKMKNIYAVLQAIWNGSIDRANRLDPTLSSLSDGYITFDEYVERLGRDVGRKYKPYGRKGTAIHVGYRSGCPTCQSIQRSGEAFFPHEAG